MRSAAPWRRQWVKRRPIGRMTTATEARPSAGDGASSPYQPEAQARELPEPPYQSAILRHFAPLFRRFFPCFFASFPSRAQWGANAASSCQEFCTREPHVVRLVSAPYDEIEVRGGRDDRRGVWVRVPRLGDRLRRLDPEACRGGKSGLHRARWWVTPTVRPRFGAARIGKVPQKIDRLGRRASGAPVAVRVKRRGKSSPAGWVTSLARQTPSGARPNKEAERLGRTRSGGSNRRVPTAGRSRIGPVRHDFRVGRLRRQVTGVPEK
jgi:hypothetical protein